MDDKKKLLERIRLFVLDMDGTFYLGEQLYKGSLGFIDKVLATNRRFLFFTNNSSRTPELYIKKLARMGLDIDRSGIMTSGDVMIEYLNKHYRGSSVYLMGTEALKQDFSARGIALTEDRQPDVVVVSFDTELTYAKLERACSYIRNGAVFLATHLDINCPTETGFIPDCGSFCAAIELSTGQKPRYLGKPFPETLEMIVSVTGTAKEEIAFIGDRLYTDVATGVNGGAYGILVLSGETSLEDVECSEIKPHAIFADLEEIALYL